LRRLGVVVQGEKKKAGQTWTTGKWNFKRG